MSDKILIRQLKVDAIIGIHQWEKQQPQPLVFDLDLSFDCKRAAHSDDIKDALDYFQVCHQITELVAASNYDLIESLAERVAALVLTQFSCKKVKLTVYKPNAIDNTKTVGICIVRQV